MLLADEEIIPEEYHEHPWFNGQWHRAVWVQTWVSGDTNKIEVPEGAPISCSICGRPRGF